MAGRVHSVCEDVGLRLVIVWRMVRKEEEGWLVGC